MAKIVRDSGILHRDAVTAAVRGASIDLLQNKQRYPCSIREVKHG